MRNDAISRRTKLLANDTWNVYLSRGGPRGESLVLESLKTWDSGGYGARSPRLSLNPLKLTRDATPVFRKGTTSPRACCKDTKCPSAQGDLTLGPVASGCVVNCQLLLSSPVLDSYALRLQRRHLQATFFQLDSRKESPQEQFHAVKTTLVDIMGSVLALASPDGGRGRFRVPPLPRASP